MNRIAFFSRSIYMMEAVSSELKAKGNKTYLLSHHIIKINHNSFDDIIYLPKLAKTMAEYDISDEILLNSGILQFEYMRKIKGRSIKSKQLQLIKKHMTAIKDILLRNQVDTVILYNGSTIIERIAFIIAKNLGLKTIFIEEGFFRPFTISIDPNGVNAQNSVPRERNFYESLEINQELLTEYLTKPMQVKEVNRRFEALSVKILHKITYGPINKLLELSGYQIKTDYMVTVGYVIHKLLRRPPNMRQSTKVDLPEKFIFAPLQVHNDSQVLLYSPNIESIHKFIEILIHSITDYNKKYDENYTLVIKRHPLDYIKYNKIAENTENCSIIMVDDYDINELIDRCSLIITVNSTTAIEGLIHGKQVISLGDAFYNIEGIVNHCDELSNLPNMIHEVLSKEFSDEICSRFLFYLRFIYNTEGFLNTKDSQTIVNIANRVMKLV